MMHARPTIFRHALMSALLAVTACTKAPIDEHLRPPGSSGTGGDLAEVGGPGREPGGGMAAWWDSDAGEGGGVDGPRGPGGPGGPGTTDDGVVPLGPGLDAGLVGEQPPFSTGALLRATADCVTAQLVSFERDAAVLAQETAEYAALPDAVLRQRAQGAWLAAMRSWQRVESMRIGPAAGLSAPGGEGLRDQIYIFPLGSACRVDQQLAERAYRGDDFADSLANARGLSALEYLLFHGGSANACAAGVTLNAGGVWAQLSAAELAARRAEYSAVAAADVLGRARQLLRAWQPAHGGFGGELSAPGAGGGAYTSESQALNALTDALFYLEKEVKDYKLGWPLGYVLDCANAPGACPFDVESRYARASTDHIRQNLVGFRRLFQGCGPDYRGLGVDDWLRDRGEGELAERMLGALRDAQAAVDALDPPVEEAAQQSPPQALAGLHADIKRVTDPLKTELVTVLHVDLPATAEGDND